MQQQQPVSAKISTKTKKTRNKTNKTQKSKSWNREMESPHLAQFGVLIYKASIVCVCVCVSKALSLSAARPTPPQKPGHCPL